MLHDGRGNVAGPAAGAGAERVDAAHDREVAIWSPPARTFMDAALSGSVYETESAQVGELWLS